MEDQYKFPDKYKPKPKTGKLTDSSLSLAIKKYVELNGGMCDIIKTSGTFRKGKEEVIAKGMFSVTLQKSKSFYSKSNATKGASDNSIVMISNSGILICWKCENKIGKDKQSEDQKDYEAKVNSLKPKQGIIIYSIVSDFQSFLNQYNKLKSL